jgi:hypothetical protein
MLYQETSETSSYDGSEDNGKRRNSSILIHSIAQLGFSCFVIPYCC